jgi:hypothetical protein
MPEQNNSSFRKDIFAINANLADLQFSMACMMNAVAEYDFNRIPENYRKETEERTILMKYSVLVIYQFAFFESHINWSTWKVYEDDYPVKRLMAYRHLRHAFAHSFNGKRVYREKNARNIECEMFDLIMKSNNPLVGVKLHSNDCVSVNNDSIMELNYLLRSMVGIHISRTQIL